MSEPKAKSQRSPAQQIVAFGVQHWRAGNKTEAIDAFERALEFDFDEPTAWQALGAAYAQTKEYPRSYAFSSRALDLQPDMPMTLRNIYVFGRDGDRWRLAATRSGG